MYYRHQQINHMKYLMNIFSYIFQIQPLNKQHSHSYPIYNLVFVLCNLVKNQQTTKHLYVLLFFYISSTTLNNLFRCCTNMRLVYVCFHYCCLGTNIEWVLTFTLLININRKLYLVSLVLFSFPKYKVQVFFSWNFLLIALLCKVRIHVTTEKKMHFLFCVKKFIGESIGSKQATAK